MMNISISIELHIGIVYINLLTNLSTRYHSISDLGLAISGAFLSVRFTWLPHVSGKEIELREHKQIRYDIWLIEHSIIIMEIVQSKWISLSSKQSVEVCHLSKLYHLNNLSADLLSSR